MKRFLVLLMILSMATLPASAQALQGQCDRTMNVIVGPGSTTTYISAGDRDIKICGFLFTATTAGSTVKFNYGTGATALSPNYMMAAWGNVSYPSTSVTFIVPAGNLVSVTAGTGQVIGHFTYGFF